MSVQSIDFKYIRQHADIGSVLAAYGVTLTKDGSKPGQYKCLCPFHDDHEPSMKVNTERNIYNCFVCDEGGNILDFVMQLDGIDIRKAAKRVAEICNIATAPDSPSIARSRKKPAVRGSKSPIARRTPETARKVGQPVKSGKHEPESTSDVASEELDGVPYNRLLTFELKNLITDHPFIAERGISEEMRVEFGIGVATRGIMKDRLVFPIHNKDGELVAYCGRYIGDDPPADEPKYKQPPNFRKELELFNWHRVKGEVDESPLVVVESFFSVVKLHELSYRCVSPMGRSLSEAQIALLEEGGEKELILLFDGDDPGRDAIKKVGRDLLAAGLTVVAPVVPEDFKPHRTGEKLLRVLLSG